MSHHIYKTEGIALKSWEVGEADRFFSFFTRDYGKIRAGARGARYLKSKLRYSLSGFSVVRLAFVSTQNNHFRLVDAEEIENFDGIRKNLLKTNCVKNILNLFSRLVQGEQLDYELWKYLKEMFDFLNNKTFDKSKLKDFEVFAVLRMLQILGYGPDSGAGTTVGLNEINKRRSFWVNLINETLEQTQL